MLKRSRLLVTLRDDLPLEWNIEACRFAGVNQSALRRHVENLGFTTLLKRLDQSAPLPPPAPVKATFEENLFGSAPAAPATESFGTAADGSYILSVPEEFEGVFARIEETKAVCLRHGDRRAGRDEFQSGGDEFQLESRDRVLCSG
jgi:hypothetical protein